MIFKPVDYYIHDKVLGQKKVHGLAVDAGILVKFAVRHDDNYFEPWKADDWVTGMAIPGSNGKTPEDAARNAIAALQKAGEHRYNAAVENASRNGGLNARR